MPGTAGTTYAAACCNDTTSNDGMMRDARDGNSEKTPPHPSQVYQVQTSSRDKFDK